MFNLSKSLIIGVDGGGTGCRAAIGTATEGILARGAGGAANFSTDPDLAIANVEEAVTEAAAKLGFEGQSLATATTHVGLAGALTDDDHQRIMNALPFGTITVTDDRPTSVAGALGTDSGYLLSVGTGTIAATNTNNDLRYIGGWGFQISDHASGAWLGRAALEQAMLCYDGLSEHAKVTRDLLAKFDNDPNKVVAFSMTAKPGDFGAFSPDVVRGAIQGDPWALNIMNKGARHLSDSLDALGFLAGDTLCLSGGLGPHYAAYLAPAYTQSLIPERGNALDGAFQLACQNSHQQSGGMS